MKLKDIRVPKGKIDWWARQKLLRLRAALAYRFPSKNGDWTPLFLVGSPRVGSHFLRTFLNSHPHIDLGAEILLPSAFYGLPIRSRGEALLRHAQGMMGLSHARVRGFKMHFHQMAHREISYEMLNEAFPTAKYMILYRGNLFDQACSESLAAGLNRWIRRDSSDKSYEPITVDPQRFESKLNEFSEGYVALRRDAPWMASRSLPVCFETLIADQEGASRDFLEFLDLPQQTLKGTTHSQRDRPIRDYLLNLDDLAHLDTPANNEFRFTWDGA